MGKSRQLSPELWPLIDVILFSYIELIFRGGVSWLPAALLFSVVLDGILFILTGNDDIHESLDEFKIGQIRPLVFMATDRVIIIIMTKTVSPLFLGCFSSDPFHTCR